MAGHQRSVGVCALLVLCVAHLAYCDLFTALVELEKVLVFEKSMSQDLKRYIRQEENRLDQLRKIADEYDVHSSNALIDPEKYLANALNAYLVIKKFTVDWQDVSKLITHSTGQDFLDALNLQGLPNSEDLQGAAMALLRLQDTYALPTEKIARGELQGVKQSPMLTAADCFELGRVAYNLGDHYHVIMWMNEALHVLNAETNKTADPSMLLDYLAYSTYMQGNIKAALNITRQWLIVDPNHQRAANNKKYYEQMLEKQEKQHVKGDIGDSYEENGDSEVPFENKRILDDYRKSAEFSNYEALCRGENTQVIKDAHKLSCQYKRHHPFFYINPLKEELMHVDPWIVQYHDVITKDEVRKVKELAAPRLKRATVQNPLTGKLETAYYRVSKSAWLRDEEHYLIKRISGRVRALSNLTLETAEELQVVNYGIGGHYEPHYDFARKEEKGAFSEKAGNRVATAIFYMTRVDAGGLTVFPQIGAKVYPVERSMAFWYNLKQSGEGDFLTRHAGCPVLTGSKWVANKWIHERGQEFTRPCATNPEL